MFKFDNSGISDIHNMDMDITIEVDDDEPQMAESNVVFLSNDNQTEVINLEDEDIELSATDIMELIYTVVEAKPNLVKISPMTSAMNAIQHSIVELESINMDLLSAVETLPAVREFLWLLLSGYLATKSTVKRGYANSSLSVVYIPQRFTGDPEVIVIGGLTLFKGKPVLSVYSKSKYDEVIRKTNKSLNKDSNIVDTLMESGEEFVCKKNTNIAMDISTGFFSDAEIASLIIDGSMGVDDIKVLPQNRQTRIMNVLNLLN